MFFEDSAGEVNKQGFLIEKVPAVTAKNAAEAINDKGTIEPLLSTRKSLGGKPRLKRRVKSLICFRGSLSYLKKLSFDNGIEFNAVSFETDERTRCRGRLCEDKTSP